MVLAVLMFAALLAGGTAAEGSYGIIYLTPSAASACWSQVEVGILQAKADLEKELGITINYSVVGPEEEQEIIEGVQSVVMNVLGGERQHVDWTGIRETLKDDVATYLYQQTRRRPLVLPITVEV